MTPNANLIKTFASSMRIKFDTFQYEMSSSAFSRSTTLLSKRVSIRRRKNGYKLTWQCGIKMDFFRKDAILEVFFLQVEGSRRLSNHKANFRSSARIGTDNASLCMEGRQNENRKAVMTIVYFVSSPSLHSADREEKRTTCSCLTLFQTAVIIRVESESSEVKLFYTSLFQSGGAADKKSLRETERAVLCGFT